jgi:hypothetical protein
MNFVSSPSSTSFMTSNSVFPDEKVKIKFSIGNTEQIELDCKKVPVYGTDGSIEWYKLITDTEQVLVLISEGFGAGWSSWCSEQAIKKRLIFDSELIRILTDPEYKKLLFTSFCEQNCLLMSDDTYNDADVVDAYGDGNYDAESAYYETKHNQMRMFLSSVLKCSEFSMYGFDDLVVKLVPQGKRFRITEYDGCESIEYFDPLNYYEA